MVRNEFKEKIISYLIHEEINDVNSFLTKLTHLEIDKFEPKNKNASISFYHKDINFGDKIYIPKDDKILILKLKQFISFWDKLEKLGYIYTIPHSRTQNKELIPIVKRERWSGFEISPIYNIILIVEKYLDKEIVPDIEELKNFVKNNYLTVVELAYEKEKKSRKIAQKLTIIIAILSMLISIGITIFNYKTNTKEREVILKNITFPNDTLKVFLINSDSLSDKVK